MNSETIGPNRISQNSTQVMEEMPHQKNAANKNLALIVILAILAVGGLGFGGFELWQNMQKDNKIRDLQAANDVVEKEDVDGNGEGDSENDSASFIIKLSDNTGFDSRAMFDTKKCKNCSVQHEYSYISFAGSGREIWVANNIIRVEDGLFSGFAGGFSSEYNLDFTKDIADIYLGSFGNGGSEALLFLMNDGTVEYAAIDGENTPWQIKQYSAIQGVSNIVGFYTVGDSAYNGPTTLAIDKDGYFYNLSETEITTKLINF